MSTLRYTALSKGTSFFLVLALVSSTPIGVAEGENDYPVSISIDYPEESVIVSETILQVSITDESTPESASWELFDSISSRHYVSISEFSEQVGDSNSLNHWVFDIQILPEMIGSCSCILLITVVESTGNVVTEASSIFIDQITVPDYQFPPTLHIARPNSESWHSQSYDLAAISASIDGTAPNFFAIVRESSNVKCTYNSIDTEDGAYAINNNETRHPSISGELWDGESLTFDLDLFSYTDGWYDIVIFAQYVLQNAHYSHDCISIRIDNSPPIAMIDGPQTLTEGSGAVIFDASSTSDDYWGIQGLTYIWSINELGSSYEPIMQVFNGKDMRTIEFIHDDSGVFEIKLSVSDYAGNIGHNSTILEIENLPPVVRLSIDGVPFSENDMIAMSRESSIQIDASSSSDTPNDIDGLRYIWRVNNIPTYEGPSREFTWPEGVGEDFVLTIEVIDDDSESSMISVMVTDDSQSDNLPVSIVLLIFSCIFLSFSIFRRSKSEDSEIPKWK